MRHKTGTVCHPQLSSGCTDSVMKFRLKLLILKKQEMDLNTMPPLSILSNHHLPTNLASPISFRLQSSQCDVVFSLSGFCLSPDAADVAVIGLIPVFSASSWQRSVAVTTVTLPTGLIYEALMRTRLGERA